MKPKGKPMRACGSKADNILTVGRGVTNGIRAGSQPVCGCSPPTRTLGLLRRGECDIPHRLGMIKLSRRVLGEGRLREAQRQTRAGPWAQSGQYLDSGPGCYNSPFLYQACQPSSPPLFTHFLPISRLKQRNFQVFIKRKSKEKVYSSIQGKKFH